MYDTLFEMVMNAKMRPDYKYNEPNEYKKIKKLREDYDFDFEMPDEETLRKNFWVHGRAEPADAFSENLLNL